MKKILSASECDRHKTSAAATMTTLKTMAHHETRAFA
jgi:hypothetical protein